MSRIALTFHSWEFLCRINIERRAEDAFTMMHIRTNYLKEREFETIRPFRTHAQVWEYEEAGITALSPLRWRSKLNQHEDHDLAKASG